MSDVGQALLHALEVNNRLLALLYRDQQFMNDRQVPAWVSDLVAGVAKTPRTPFEAAGYRKKDQAAQDAKVRGREI